MKQFSLLLLIVTFASRVFSQTQLWGISSAGGQYNAGVIFNTDSSGNNQTIQQNLFQYEGAKPLFSNLMQANDGKLYGMTYLGGIYNLGTLFQYNPVTNVYTKLLDFDGANNGSKPFGSLMQAGDGMLYGMTYKGGVYNKGVLFQYDIVTNTYTKKLDFDGANNGRNPHRSLIEAHDGMLYGLAVQGGTNDQGVLFQYNYQTSTYTKKIDLDSLTMGINPLGDLIEAHDRMLYGLCVNGGSNSLGSLFQYNIATNTLTTKFNFDGINGTAPLGSLTEATDGNLYSVTNNGGANNVGVMFQYNPTTNMFNKKLDFDSLMHGRFPYGCLMQAADSNIYGMTTLGGASDMGILFQYNISTDVFVKKFDFAGASNGSNPYSSLMQANDGMLYSMTNLGGANDLGVLFQYNFITSTYNKKLDFGATNGRMAKGSLLYASDGMFYGLTSEGGIHNNGVLFQYNPTNFTYTKKFEFYGVNGLSPQGYLIQATDGNLYGLTTAGGTSDSGVIFKYNPNTNALTKLFDFGGLNGRSPQGSLIQANDGNLYGLTSEGGTNDSGILFQYNITTNVFAKKFDFTGTTTGSNPHGDLMQATNGLLYGMTNLGGINNLGVLFEYNLSTNVLVKKYDFNGLNGSFPEGNLTQSTDGNLYGLTYIGGALDLGVLFQFNPTTNSFSKKIDFDGNNNGGNPFGSLTQSSNGNLYGMTYSGGANDVGVMFQYNPNNNAFLKKLDFDYANGRNPFGSLIAVNIVPTKTSQHSNINTQFSIFPNPSNGSFTIQSKQEGNYIIVNSLGEVIQSFKLYQSNNYTMHIDDLSAGIYFVYNKGNVAKVVVIKP